MVWTAPMTAVAGAFTAAQFNTHIRDNLAITAPAVAAVAGGYPVATGANALVERRAEAATSALIAGETTTSTTYADLATVGPSLTLATGTRALVGLSVKMANTGAGVTRSSVAVSGATTIAADDDWAIALQGVTANNASTLSSYTLFTSLTPGNNTFTIKYRVSSGTGSFHARTIIVVPF